MEDQFYLQDSRSYVGNDMLFWCKDGAGYTTDLRKAEIYTKEDAMALHRQRETNIPWPKSYIDAKTRPAVDMQHVSKTEALRGTGIELIKPRKPKQETYRCHSCGKFLSISDYYSSCGCPHCKADNRP